MPAVSWYNPTGNAYLDGLLMGTKWGVTSLTFSFPTNASFYGASYGNGEPTNNFEAFTATQQSAIRTILQSFSAVTNINFTEITETASQHADLRYAESDATTTAWGYYPSPSMAAGDAWFNNNKNLYDNPVSGNYAWFSMLHEIGHTLGLKHPHEATGSWGALPADRDSIEYTVMSYRSYIGHPTGGYTASTYPQTLMMYDIAALQFLYGADYTTHSGDTVYTWSPTTGQHFVNGVGQTIPNANKIFMTVWDGGGNDTYNFSNYSTNLTVNLQPGTWTNVSATQLAALGGGNNAAGNIANAMLFQGNLASLIENAVGGTGHDNITGNQADNRLTGGGGNDILDGEGGNDTAVYSGQFSNYQLVDNGNGSWTITDLRGGSPDGVDTLTDIERAQFSDQLVSLDTINNPPAVSPPTITSFSNDTATVGDRITSDNTLTLTGTAAANSSVSVYDGAVLLGTATANGSGAWSFATAVLADGVHSFTATATSGGSTSSPSTALSITVDTVAPSAATISGYSVDSGVVGDGITNQNTLTLIGGAQAGSIVHVYDGGVLLGTATANGSGTWSFTTFDAAEIQPAFVCICAACGAAGNSEQTGRNGASAGGITDELADGVHSFTVVAYDAAGNFSGASSALNVTIDTVAAAAPVISSYTTDTGTPGDGITNDNTPTLSGTAEAGSTIKVYDGANLLGTTTANGSGAWSYTSGALGNGAYSLTARAVDVAGNTSAASAVLNLTVDTVAAAPVISSYSTDSGTAGDGITNDNTPTLSGTAEANSTVNIYDGATLLGTTTANGVGAWSYTSAALSNGAHSLTATATDVAGNTSSASAALNLTIDTVAAGAPVISSYSTDTGALGDGITADNTISLSGTAEANSTVRVYDGATLLGSVTTNGSGAWNYTPGALSNGAHSLTATATDAAGNTSAASAALNVTIDTVAASAPVISSYSTDTGTAGDGITSDNTIALGGTAEANSTVRVYDGATLLDSVTANGSGAWTYTTGALSNGSHSLTATATDSAGNTSAASTALNLTIDTVAALAPVISSYSTDTGTLGDGITSDNTINLNGTAEANSTVKVYDGATLLGSTTANGSGAWSYTSAALSDGAHSLTATATDAAGNTSAASGVLNLTIDTIAVGAPVISSYSTDTGIVGDGITSDNTITLNGMAEANSTIKVYDGATLLGTTTANGSGGWSYTTAALSNGAHSLTATASDVAGNTSAASAALNLTIAGLGAPVINSYSTDSGAAGDGITSDNTIALSGTAEANSTVRVYDGATLLGTTTANGSGSWSYTTGALSNGAHTLTATATDAVGNTSAASPALNLTIDTVAASAPVISTYSADTGTAGDGLTSDNTPTLSGTAEAGSTVKVYDGATLLGSVTANGSGAWSYTTGALSNGAHVLTATATDAAGNTSATSAALNLTIDTAAPVVPTISSYSSDTGAVGDGITSDNTITLSGTADADSIINVYDGATLVGFGLADGDGAWTYTTSALSNGAHSLTVTATDAAGNTSTVSAALNLIIDTVAAAAPVISAYSTDTGTVGDRITSDNTPTLSGTAEANSTVKVYDGATLLGTATANGSGAWSYTTGALSNGSHKLTATATDAAGNTSAASTALNLTIDTVAAAPVISSYSTDTGTVGDGITSDNTITLNGTAEANSTVRVYDGATLLGTATANGSGAWSYTSAALSNGSHTLTATATDPAGNTSAASAAVSVTIDTVAASAPVISSYSTDTGTAGDGITSDNTIALNGTAEANTTVRIYDGATLLGSTTANGSGAWTYTTGALSNGSHSLTARATDAAGNTSAASTALSLTIDTVAAAAPVISSYSTDTGTVGDGVTSDNTITLNGTAEANSTIRVYDGATLLGSATANGSGAWSFTSAPLSNGPHSLTATATDVAGNTSIASAALNLTIDTTAANAPVISSYSTDTGTAGDGITSDNTLTLNGTAEVGSTVKVYDGATLLGTTTASAGGVWSYTTAALNDGAHTLTATATDISGNTSAGSAALNIIIDALAPTAPTLALPLSGVLILTGAAEAGSTVKIYDGATLLGTTVANGSGSWSYIPTALSNTIHGLTATATDTAGNASADSARALIGSSGNDALSAGAGDDWLDGRSGADTMAGGLGSDSYFVDNVGDVVTEAAEFALPASWTLKGTADFNNDGELDVLVSSASANQIWLLNNQAVSSATNVPHAGTPGWQGWSLTGLADLNNDGHQDLLYTHSDGRQWGEYLNGMTRLYQGAYYAGVAASVSPALASGGTDTVVSSISYALSVGVENLTLASAAGSINGTGNAQNNVIIGNEAANVIRGLAGADTLTGNGGADVFAFATGDSSAALGQRDLITDFTPGQDVIDLTAIDANTATSVRDAFRFLGTGAFDGTAGALHTVYDSVRGVTVLEADVNGDTIADFAVDLGGNLTLSVTNFTAGSLLLPINATGTAGSEALTGDALNDQLYGLGGNDTLTGKAGDDWLDGGTGADTMAGGVGNDTYVVDNAGDVVTEFALPAGWTLKGAADFNNDGELDVLVSSASANQIWLLNNQAVSSVTNVPHASMPGWQNWSLTGLSDLNNDGHKDLLYTHGGGQQWGAYLNGTTLLNRGAYYSGKTADTVQPLSDYFGTDTVVSSISYALSGGVENLTLASGAGSINGTGNAQNNVIIGNEGNNVLTGLAGDDHLDGGAGADAMAGGLGADTYIVDNVGDVVTEESGFATPTGWTLKGTADFNNDGQLDVLVSSASENQIWLLNNQTVSSVTNVPHASMPGWQNWSLTGLSDLNNDGHKDLLYTHTSGQQWGAYLQDTTLMNKGAYYTGKSADAVQPLPGTETDTVESSVSYALSSGVENLTLKSGAGSINGTGNALNNVIVGNEGANVISGLAGADTLTGNGGADTFVFTAPFGGIDTITDFVSGLDVLQISASGFGGGLAVGESATLVMVGSAATASHAGADGYFIFDNAGADAGTLLWDATGGTGADAVAIARLQNVASLQQSDFQIV